MKIAVLHSVIAVVLTADLATADTVVPARPIRAQSIIVETDLSLRAGDLVNSFQSITAVVGQDCDPKSNCPDAL